MSEVFSPPPEEAITRPRPGTCRAFGPKGERCALYWSHESTFHKDGHGTKWLSEDEYA